MAEVDTEVDTGTSRMAEVDTELKCKPHLSEEEFCKLFEDLIEAKYRYLPDTVRPSSDKPPWVDDALIAKGQEFASKYFAAINFGQLLGLCTLFSFTHSLRPLIFTRKSDSEKTASIRYTSTAIVVKSWFEEDLWNPESKGLKNIIAVRKQHLNISNKMNKSDPEEIIARSTLSNLIPPFHIKATLYKTVQQDFKGCCPVYFDKYNKSEVYFNQAEMLLTLFGFMGMVVYDPEKLGIPSEDKEGLAGFVHLWRTIAYLLGVEDKYNFCRGDLNEVKERCDRVVNRIFIANMESISQEWEHMARCVLGGINDIMHTDLSFDVVLLYMFWALGWNVDGLKLKLGWISKWRFFIFKSVFTILYRISFIRNIANNRLKNALQLLDEKNKAAQE